MRSPPGRCLACGDGDHGHDLLKPFGIETTGHAWLHSACWPAWYAGRKAEAVAALEAMNISFNRIEQGGAKDGLQNKMTSPPEPSMTGGNHEPARISENSVGRWRVDSFLRDRYSSRGDVT